MNERDALAVFLQAQRDVILAIVDGLDDEQVCQSVVPSGWTPIGMIEHLGDAERVWFQELVAGADPPPAAAVTNVGEAVSYYRTQAARTDEIVAAASLDAPLARPVPAELECRATTVREAILHLIEETARHAGHLDIARELLDGTTGLGCR